MQHSSATYTSSLYPPAKSIFGVMPKEQTLHSSAEGLGFPILAKGSYFKDLPVIKHLQSMEHWPHLGLHHLCVTILFLMSEPDGLCCVVCTWPHVRVNAFFDQSLGG